MRHWITAIALVASLVSEPAWAADPAALVQEINLTSSAATAVIGGLQDRINAGQMVAADLDPARIRSAYAAAYQRLANRPMDVAADAPLQEIRATIDQAMGQVLETFRADILRGGPDAFVPAFFRAQLFDRFNQAMDGRFRAIATTRRSELINADSAVDRLIPDAEIIAAVNSLLEQGTMRSETRVIGGRTMGYWPMTIGEACAACHQRNGLRQQVGQFGGATVVIAGR
jgi:hypothetical protein